MQNLDLPNLSSARLASRHRARGRPRPLPGPAASLASCRDARRQLDLPAGAAGRSDRLPRDTMNKVRRTFAVIVGLGAMLAASPSLAQTWPDRPIKIIAPFPAGGLVDVL